jgi:hypothetical protein
MVFAALNSLFLLAYLLSALVQYNDPDPLAWIAIYLLAAGMCIARFRRYQPRWLALSLYSASLLWIGMLLPNIIGQVSLAEIVESISMKTRAVEEAREIGGLALITLWSGLLMTPWGRRA